MEFMKKCQECSLKESGSKNVERTTQAVISNRRRWEMWGSYGNKRSGKLRAEIKIFCDRRFLLQLYVTLCLFFKRLSSERSIVLPRSSSTYRPQPQPSLFSRPSFTQQNCQLYVQPSSYSSQPQSCTMAKFMSLSILCMWNCGKRISQVTKNQYY